MKKKLILTLLLVLALTFATLVACEKIPEQFTVTFAGEGVSVAAQTVESGSTVMDPKTPTREGYTFKYWYLTDEGTPFDFSTPITGDITLNALWEKNEQESPPTPPTPPIISDDITGTGTSEDPYVLYKAAHILDVAKWVNEGNEAYVAACYKLGADIDLNGVAYTPIGTFDHPFEGKLDGDGKIISNLTLSPAIRSDGLKFYGLFGMTEKAVIRNLTLADISLDISSYRDGDNVTAYIGGVVGYASLTTFESISVNGKISTFLMADNGANIGGIAGWCANSSSDQAYIVYLENCFANIEIGIDEQDGEKGSLENGRVGGLFGVIYNYNCAAAIINCATSGTVYGGQYTGGIVGYINGLTSIISCYNAANVTATATSVSYAGGIVGSALDDNLIMDCASIGDVTAPKAGQNTYNYKSYAGAVAGYAESDDYTYYYSAGSNIVNCYYAADATGADNISKHGTKYALSYLSKLDNLINRVHLTAACWTSDSGVIKPTDKTASEAATDGKYVLTLKNGEKSENLDMSVSVGTGYTLVGILDDIAADNSNLFWAWELADDIQYKYYMPIVKNITLTARWQDVSDIAKAYKGTGTLHTTNDAGSIVLNTDGTLQWINDSAVGGTYKYNGKNIIMDFNSNTGTVSGILNKGSLTFEVDAGMTGTVEYAFTAYEPKIIGEYISENGNLLTFAGVDRVSYENTDVNNGNYIGGTYEASGNTLTPTFKYALSGIVPGNIVIQNETTVVFHFTQGGVAKTETFTKLGVVDYSGEGFVGEYNYNWVSSPTFIEKRQLRFDADGRAVMITPYGNTDGRYYYIESTGSIKLILETYVSSFKYDENEDVLYGIFARGYSTKRPTVFTKAARGAMEAYTNLDATNYKKGVDDIVYLYSLADGKCYVFVNDEYSVLTPSKPLGEHSDIMINGTTFRIYSNELARVGAEMGTYTYGSAQITLDGVKAATITGANAGEYVYYAHADNYVTVILDTSVITFNFVEASENENVIDTTAANDGAAGVWYSAKNGNPYYYKLVFDGQGHGMLFYMPEGGTEYRFNWAKEWGSYTVTSYGVKVAFNSSNKDIRFVFYYNRNFAYVPDSFGGSSDYNFITKGYEGSTEVPVFPSAKAGSYVSQQGSDEWVLNIRADLSGTYRGNPITDVIFDGENKVYFTCNSVNYTFTFTQNGGSLDWGATPIEFTSAGAITEIIPSALCGLWTGKFEGYGVSTNDSRGFEIQSDGTVYYYSNVSNDDKTQASNVSYDYSTLTITFTDAGGFVWTLVYNAEEKTFSGEGRNDENITLSATLSKASN